MGPRLMNHKLTVKDKIAEINSKKGWKIEIAPNGEIFEIVYMGRREVYTERRIHRIYKGLFEKRYKHVTEFKRRVNRNNRRREKPLMRDVDKAENISGQVFKGDRREIE